MKDWICTLLAVAAMAVIGPDLWAEDAASLFDETPAAEATTPAGTTRTAPAPVEIDPDGTLPLEVMKEWDEELKRFDFDVEVATIRILDERLSAADFAARNRIRGAVHPPRLAPEMVEAKIEEHVNREVLKAFPEEAYEKIREDAEKEFALFEKGTRIQIRARLRGHEEILDGILEWVTPEFIKVASTRVAKADIFEQFLPRLYRQEHEAAVQRYIRVNTRKFNARKQEFGAQIREQTARRLWPLYGYFHLGGQWHSRYDYFQEKYQAARQALRSAVGPKLAAELYRKNGWQYDEELGRWVPEQPETTAGGESALDKLKEFLRKKAAAEEEKPPEDKPGAEEPKAGEGQATGARPPAGEGDLWADEPPGEGAKPKEPMVPEKVGPAPAKPPPAKKKGDVSDLFGED